MPRDDLFLFLKPAVSRNFSLAYSKITEELTQLPTGKTVTINKDLPVCDIVRLMDGKHTVKKISRATLVSDKDILEITYLLDKEGFLNQRTNPERKMPVLRKRVGKGCPIEENPSIAFLWEKERDRIISGLLTGHGYKNLTPIDASSSIGKTIKTIKRSDLVISPFISTKLLALFNRCRRLFPKTKWIFYNLDFGNRRIDIGPFVFDGKSSCLNCYRKRLKENSFIEKKDYIFRLPDPKPTEIEYKLFAVNMANVIAIFLSGDNSLKNKIVSIDLARGKIRKIDIIKDPTCCPGCYFTSEKIKLKHRKALFFENGLRVVHAKDTWLRAKKYISHVGVISKTIRYKNTIRNQYNFKAFSNDPSRYGQYLVTAGKGLSLYQNRNSAVMEAIERYCASYAASDPFKKIIIGSYKELKSIAVPPEKFRIPTEGYSDLKKIKWIKAWSLTQNTNCLLPLDFVSYADVGSNGLASGNCMEEAVLHGILELVERDIYMIADLNEIVMPDIDLASVKDQKLTRLLDDLDRSNLFYRIKYILNTNDIPTFGMFIKGRVGDRNGYSYSVSSHLDKDIALSRTVTEAIQIFPKFAAGKRWLNKNTEHYVKPGKVVRFDEIKDYRNSDIKANINKCISLLKKQNMDIFAVNFSLPNIDFVVVRVLISGLQPVWQKEKPYITERVFTVPKILGFSPKKIGHLNFGDYAGFAAR